MSSKNDERSREEERRMSHKERAEKIVRVIQSKDRDNRTNRSPGREKIKSRRSRSRSPRKQDRLESRKHSKYSKSPEKARIYEHHAKDSKKSRKSRSRSPKKADKRNSVSPKRVEKVVRLSRSPKRRSPTPKRGNENRRRSISARKRSLTPKRSVVEQRKENVPEKRRPANSPPSKAPIRRRSPSRERQQSRNAQRRSSSRNRPKRRASPIGRKREPMRSRSPIPRKASRYSVSPRNHRRHERRNDRRSRSRSLSYSPARRNPEKYREILNKSNENNRKSGPIVKIYTATSDRESSDNEVRRSKSIEKVVEFLPIDNNQEKELSRLKALKSELAAKAKESLEKKKISESATTSVLVPGKSSGYNDSPPKSIIDPGRARELEIVAQTVAISTKEKQAAIKEREDKTKVRIKPFKINDGSSPKKNSTEGLKVSGTAVEKPRESRSHSRSSQK